MSRRYDTRTTIFSPEGRLFQVEYAMEAIRHAPTCIGISAKDGLVLMAERANTNKLLDNEVFADKLYQLDKNTICGVAGITSDANILTEQLRLTSQKYSLLYQQPMPVEQLVSSLCNLKQRYTQIGGYRPFGVSLIYAGWDRKDGYQLYQSDPSGNYSGWKATCIGKSSNAAISMLKQEYKEDITLDKALLLAVKVLSKTLDVQKLTSEKIEVSTLRREGERTSICKMSKRKLEELLKECEKQEEEEKKKKEQKSSSS